MKILKEKASLFFRNLGLFLKKEHKIQTAYIIMAVIFAAKGKEEHPLYVSMVVLSVLLFGMSEDSKKHLFSWAEPWTILMPLILPLTIYLIFKSSLF